ncbi:cytochrome c biogenesis protein DipZ [Novosphingobium sp. BL-52-GroH]|uniref:cytochrome c biogenesis protein DipZ n=1 Tax=Novosphingobium sp. BL-52-GroH TaxID=3349877 RepID=UPI00384CEB85
MLLYILSYLGGALTIVSPCILPVLPFVFARAGGRFATNGLPLLVGMAAMFMAVATLAAVGGGWAVQANQLGRGLALALLALFGLTLLLPGLSDRLTRPLVDWGARLSQRSGAVGSEVGSSFLIGIATGLLWAPCAGPILGLVLTGAALQGASLATSLLLLAYAAGAATSLALALLAGGRVFALMKRSIGVGQRVRQVLGAAVLVAVAAIALGADTGVLSRLSQSSTSRIEQRLLASLGMAGADQPRGPATLAVEGRMPPLVGVTGWINSPPLSPAQLKGKVVLIDVWTYSCVNCLRTLPYVRAWAEKYRDQGLVVIGVHSPEFAFEKDPANVRKAVRDLGITYPVALDNDFAVWRALGNKYWPAHYFIDAKGQIRAHHFGEGSYAESERIIQRLLAEARGAPVAQDIVAIAPGGAQAARGAVVASRETYIGYRRAQGFASPGGFAHDKTKDYALGARALNGWSLGGRWTVQAKQAVDAGAGARIAYRFRARDLNLVLGSGGKPVRFRITLDGAPPGADHGMDVDALGEGVIGDHRLYQLVRQKQARERDFVIEFLDPGTQAYAFTFG